MFVDLLLSKHKHNGAAVRRVLMVLGVPFDACQLLGAMRRSQCAGALSHHGDTATLKEFRLSIFVTQLSRTLSSTYLANSLIQVRGTGHWPVYMKPIFIRYVH